MPLAEFELETGAKVIVEVDQPVSADVVRVSRGGDGLLKATQAGGEAHIHVKLIWKR